MNFLKNIELGHYDLIWKNICINDQNISKIKNNNSAFFHTLVAIHENTHWQQLVSSSLGHFVSFFPYFKRYTVLNFLHNFHTIDSSIQIRKPLLPWIIEFEKTCTNKDLLLFIKMIRQDLYCIDLTLKYLNSEFSVSQLKTQWNNINQAMFASYDLYLQFAKPYIEAYNPDDLIQANRAFWDKKENYQVPALPSHNHLPGFFELLECGARLVELKYYMMIKDKSKIIGKEFILDEKYLFQDDYFIPLQTFKLFFDIKDLTPETLDILSTVIFIALNPPTIPHFSYCYNEHIWVKDIHPGVRFVLACIAIKRHFGNLKKAASFSLDELTLRICEENNWPDSFGLYKDYEKTFPNLLEKSSSLFEGDGFFDNEALTDIELWLIYYYRAGKLRSQHIPFFINSAEYYFDYNKVKILEEIDRNIHCPVIYDVADKKYKVNMSGISVEAYNIETMEREILTNTKKRKSDRLQQLCVNFIKDGIFEELNDQLLLEHGYFNLTILSKIDAPGSFIEDMLKLYQEKNYINFQDIIYD